MIGFENPALILTSLLAIPLIIKAYTTPKNFIRYLLVSKVVFVVLIALALAQPFVTVTGEIETDRDTTYIQDMSESSQLIQYSDIEPDATPTTKEQTRQDIKNSLDQGNDILIESDLQFSITEIEEFTEQNNSNISFVEQEMDEDYSVHIKGPKTVVPGTEITYETVVQGTREEIPQPRLEIDGDVVDLQQESHGEWRTEHTFDSSGNKQLEASIDNKEGNDENKEYFKSVEVIEEPDILVLGGNQDLQGLEQVYDVDYSENIPDDLSNYRSAVVRDSEFLTRDVKNYVAEGNGLLYTGSPQDSVITPMIPGDDIEAEEDVEETSDTIILIDASVSRQDGPIQESKAIAHNLIDSIPRGNQVGLAAYNRQGYELEQLQRIEGNRENLKDTVSQIEPEGPTFHQEGMKTADNMVPSDGNIIMITDGLLSRINEVRGVPEKSENISTQLESNLIVLDTNPFVNPEFLKTLTENTGGEYVTADNQGTLSFAFDSRQAQTQHSTIYTLDSTHFITRNSVTATTTPKQNTGVKKGAQELLQVDQIPYLASWRYGLGRVAQINDEDADIQRLIQEDSETSSRIIGWTVGDPQEDGYNVESNRKPQRVEITSRNTGTLETTREHEETGFYTYQDTEYSYNYPKQIQNIGYNQENIEQITRLTDGERVEDPETWLEEQTGQTTETIQKERSLTKYIISLIAALFLLEVGFRKLKGKI